MSPADPKPAQTFLSNKPHLMQWCVLLLVSVVLSTLFEFGHLPASLLIGPMIAAILVGTNGATIRVPKIAFSTGQSVVGVLVAASISTSIFSVLIADWYIFIAAILGTLLASSLLGWLISSWKVMPGTTGVWGSAPGAATAMVLMAGAFGADARLVAFMQYLRVIFVSLAAAMIARLWVDTSSADIAARIWFPEIAWPALLATFAVVAVGGIVGVLVRLPSPYFLGTFILALGLRLGFDIPFQLPEWLLALSYAAVGWTIGLNFTRPVLVHATRALPQVIGSILVLMAACGAMAWGLVVVLGIDPLTAYLATSPGGMDSVAIIAAASKNVDISFIMALQMARFLVVLIIGPAIARFVSRHIRP